MKTQKSKPLLTIWLLVGALVVAAGLLAGYVFVNKTGSDIAQASKAQMDALHGEVYRLRQHTDQQASKMNYLVNPEFQRFLATRSDSSYSWLFYRARDTAWYAEVSAAYALPETHQYRLYSISAQGDTAYVGHFERIADTVGLQKIGKGQMGQVAFITSGLRETVPQTKSEEVIYQIDF